MTLRRILPLAAAVLVAAGCNAGDATYSSPDLGAGQKGLIMGGSGGFTAPGAPRLNGANMGGSGGLVGGGEETTSTSSTSVTAPGDTTSVTGRGVQMGGSGG